VAGGGGCGGEEGAGVAEEGGEEGGVRCGGGNLVVGIVFEGKGGVVMKGWMYVCPVVVMMAIFSLYIRCCLGADFVSCTELANGVGR